MIDAERELYNEGTLARTWQERLREMPIYQPSSTKRRRRHLRPTARTVYGIGGMWLAGLIVTFAAVHVMQMAYQVDHLEQTYSSLITQQQSMGLALSQKTTPYVLSRDARRFHVVLHQPLVVHTRSVVSDTSRRGVGNVLSLWFSQVRRALTGKSATSA